MFFYLYNILIDSNNIKFLYSDNLYNFALINFRKQIIKKEKYEKFI